MIQLYLTQGNFGQGLIFEICSTFKCFGILSHLDLGSYTTVDGLKIGQQVSKEPQKKSPANLKWRK